MNQPATWKRLPGVTRGMVDYVQSNVVADDFDNYFAYSQLFEFDTGVIAEVLPKTERLTIADLGCGTGRALLPLVRQGHRGLAVDLSENMLQVVRRKADAENLVVHCLRANLVQLDCLADASVDVVLCLFSTLGMIHGDPHRRLALAHMRRILSPDGRLVLHVHNHWHHLTDPGGPWNLAKNLFQSSILRTEERGDRYYSYRGVPHMYLHSFTRRELAHRLRAAQLEVLKWIPLNATLGDRLAYPWFCEWIRSSGWIVVCR